jgi:hypothetical protein
VAILDYSHLRGTYQRFAVSQLTTEFFTMGAWCVENNVAASIQLGENLCEFVVRFPTVADAVHFKLRWSERFKR